MPKRTNLYVRIADIMADNEKHTANQLSQKTGVDIQGVTSCLRGMVSRREVKVVDRKVRNAPFSYRKA